MPDNISVTRVEREMNFGWAKANPALFVEKFSDFQQEYPITDWVHRIDLSRERMVKLIAYRRDKPYASVTDYVMDGDTYLREVGMIESVPATAAPVIAQITIDMDWDHVANAVVGVAEGGYSPWLGKIAPDDFDKESVKMVGQLRKADMCWYGIASYYERGGRLLVTYDGPEDDEGTFQQTKAIGEAEFKKGFALMAEGSPGHFGDMIAENDDAITHDVFMQYVILGEVVYG